MSSTRTGTEAGTLAARLAAMRAVEGARRSIRPPSPVSAKVELVAGCSIGCRFCAATHRGRPRQLMTWACYVEVAARLRRAGIEQLGLFYMGESMEHPRLPDAIAHAKTVLEYPFVFLTANALAATPERVKACFAAGLDSLKLAVNFASPGELGQTSSIPPEAWSTQLAHVEAARRLRDEETLSSGHRCALHASSLDCGDAHRVTMAPLVEAVSRLVDSHYWLPLLGPAAGGRAKDVPCWTLFNEAHVRVDGTLSACALDAADRFVVGDLTREGFAGAWRSDRFADLRKAHLDGNLDNTLCSRCISYRTSPATAHA